LPETRPPIDKEKEDASFVQAPVQRQALFISHANPEDNEFTIWLGAHLSGAGYEVWADVLKVRGGEDWARKLENALRERACKVLLVGTPQGVEKQGVRNEIQIACEVAKKIDDKEFIIPLRLQRYDSPFQIAQAQYIDFLNGWGPGLAALLETLEEYKIPCLQSFHAASIQNWRAVQLVKARVVQHIPEKLVSNWLRIIKWPNSIKYFEFRTGVSEDRAKAIVNGSKWPVYPIARGFWTCAEKSDFHTDQGESFPISLRTESDFLYFLKNGNHDFSLNPQEARNIVSYLTKCALEKKFRDCNLSSYEYANGVLGWWIPSRLIPGDKINFKWKEGVSGRRQLVGETTSRQTKIKWHFGVSGKPWISHEPHIRIQPRILFTEDGLHAIEDAKRMHRLRRSAPKSWRNERWRDMLLAFLFWLSKGEDQIYLEAGSSSGIKIEVPPITMISPVSVSHDKGGEPEKIEVDDPVFEGDFDEFIEEDYEEDNESLPDEEEPSIQRQKDN